MIAHLRGKLIYKQPGQAIVEAAGVGYDVTISVPTFTSLSVGGAEVSLHIHTQVSEDQIALFGFLDREEKRLFGRLITVSGVGPKLAIKMLSGLSSERTVQAIRGRAVALVAGDGRKARVAEVSPEARAVAPGLAAALAMSRCPGIILRQRDPAAEVEAHRLLLAAAFTLAPRVESTRGGCCTVDLQGADPARTQAAMRLLAAELAAAGLPARIGAGPTPLLASYAARCADPVLVVRDPAAFLAPLPLAFADPSPGQDEILRGWGIGTLGGLTALPKAEVGRRLGAEGVLLWERAAGEAARVLRLVEPARSFAAEWAYEPPVESTEPLLFKLRRFAERVALELRGAGFVAEGLSLTLLLEDGTDHRREFR